MTRHPDIEQYRAKVFLYATLYELQELDPDGEWDHNQIYRLRLNRLSPRQAAERITGR